MLGTEQAVTTGPASQPLLRLCPPQVLGVGADTGTSTSAQPALPAGSTGPQASSAAALGGEQGARVVPAARHLLVALSAGIQAPWQCSLTPLSPPVIAVCVKEEHMDAASPDKTPSPELPVPVESIKQETDD